MAEPAGARQSGPPDPTTRRVERALRRFVLLGGPMALFVASLWHPETGHQDPAAAFLPVADRYLAVHLLLVPAGALLAAGLYSLVSGARGPLALVARVATAVFGFLVVVYSSIAGLAVGILATEDPSGAERATLAPLVDSLFATPVPVALALLTILSYLVAVGTTAVVLRRRGAPLVPLVALVGSTVAIYDHLGLTGAAEMGLYVLAVAWLSFRWSPDATERDTERARMS